MLDFIFALVRGESLMMLLTALGFAGSVYVAYRAFWGTSRASAGKADVSNDDASHRKATSANSLSPDDAKTTSERKAHPSTAPRGKSPAPRHHRHSESDSLLQSGTRPAQQQRSFSGQSQQQTHARTQSSQDIRHSRSSSGLEGLHGSAARTPSPKSEPKRPGFVHHSSSRTSVHAEEDEDLDNFRRLLEDNVKHILEEERRRSEDDISRVHDGSEGNNAGPSSAMNMQDAPGRYYRELARQEAIKKRNAYEASKRAYKMGQGGEARRLSEEGRAYDERLRQYNAQAAAEIFAHWNPRYGQPSSGRAFSRCDLHGLHVEEAIQYAQNHLVNCRRAGVDKTMVIVGRGSHSQQGPRIGPAILQMMSQTGGVVAGLHERNDGVIVVEFAGHQVYHHPEAAHYMRSSAQRAQPPVVCA